MKTLKYFIILFLCMSCNNPEKEKNQILNLIYSSFSKQEMEFFVFPAKQPPSSSFPNYQRGISTKKKLNNKDSLLKIKNYIENKVNQQIFAFDLKMKKYHNLKGRVLDEDITNFESLYQKFVTTEKTDFLNVHEIFPKNNDSIIAFREGLLKNKVGVGFRKFNIFISFSDIVFNIDYSKAIVIGTKGFSATDFHSHIYFLEKKRGKWKIIFVQTL